MTKDEMISILKREVKSLSTKFNYPGDYELACNDAARELGWSFPVSGDFKILWMKKRAKRHMLENLAVEQSVKFKVGDVNLQHKFAQLFKLIANWDKQFVAEMEAQPQAFADVDTFKLFGTVAEPGFAYEAGTGRDVTFDEDQEINFHPKAAD